MRLAVAPFARRVASHGPRVLCFVGKGMWDTFAGVVGKTAFVADERGDAANGGDEEVDELDDDEVKDEAAADANGAEDEPADDAEADELDEDVKPDIDDDEEEAAVNAPRNREPLFLPRDETPMVVTYTLSNGAVKREHPDEEDEAKPTAAELEGEGEGEAGAEPDDEEDNKPTADELEEMAINDAPSPLTEVNSPTPPPPNPPPARRRAPAAKAPPFSYDGPQRFRLPVDAAEWKYTYFWVVPNTSGLERTPLAEQIVLFGKLRAFVELLKAGRTPEPPAGGFLDIDLAGVGATVASMRDDAIAKGKMAPE